MRNNDSLKVAGVVFVAVGLFGVYGASAAKPEKVRICHATASASNPYNSIEVDTDAIDGAGSNDHSSHSGDIIPPVDGVTAGLNWTTAGQAIYNNDCNPVTVEETSTTVEETSTTVEETSTTVEETSTTVEPAKKVRICHATASASNPYNSIEVDTDAIDGAGSNDHSSHSGDIIPPVDGVTAGLNWTTAGQAIYNNDCNPVTVEETSTTVEETSTTVEDTTTTVEDTTTTVEDTTTTTKLGSEGPDPETTVPSTMALDSSGPIPVTGGGDASGGILYLASLLFGLGCLVIAIARRPARP